MIKKFTTIFLLIIMCHTNSISKENILQDNTNKTVSLVLGSGGARGYAHIGVIEVLEKKGYKIKSIAGSSIGALIGGLYAVGKLDEYKQWILTLNYYDIYKLLNLSSISGGVIDAEKVFDKIKMLIGDVNIEDLPIKYKAIATNLNTQTAVVFEKGKLIDAIRASIAIPTIFTPVYKDNMILVDGGILNPLPINVVSKDDTDLKIAVNLDANIKNDYIIEIPLEQLTREEVLVNDFNNLVNKAESLIPKELLAIVNKYQSKKTKKVTINEDTKQDIFFILGRTVDTAQSVLSKYSIQNHKADIIIQIPRDSCEFYEFTQAYKMIEIGKRATLNEL